MPLHYVRRLTVVSLLVYTNTYGSDMYYNTPFPHNVFSIVVFISFFYFYFVSSSENIIFGIDRVLS
jgi:hypothetical protein